MAPLFKYLVLREEAKVSDSGGSVKVFRGMVTMKFGNPSPKTVKPTMAHFFYMDQKDPSKVSRWIGAAHRVLSA
jgi:hypothetical protein